MVVVGTSCVSGTADLPVLATSTIGYVVKAENNVPVVVHDRGVRGGNGGYANVCATVVAANDFWACC